MGANLNIPSTLLPALDLLHLSVLVHPITCLGCDHDILLGSSKSNQAVGRLACLLHNHQANVTSASLLFSLFLLLYPSDVPICSSVKSICLVNLFTHHRAHMAYSPVYSSSFFLHVHVHVVLSRRGGKYYSRWYPPLVLMPLGSGPMSCICSLSRATVVHTGECTRHVCQFGVCGPEGRREESLAVILAYQFSDAGLLLSTGTLARVRWQAASSSTRRERCDIWPASCLQCVESITFPSYLS